MVTMNKPASDNTSWYTDLTNNWTTIESSILDKNVTTAKGDLLAATAASAIARVALGTNGQVLTADSTQSAGIKWTDINSVLAVFSKNVRRTDPITTTLKSYVDLLGMSLDVTVSAAAKVLAIFIGQVNCVSSNAAVRLLRGDTELRVVVQRNGNQWGTPIAIVTLDQPGAGTYTYRVQWETDGNPLNQDLTPYSTAGDRQLILVVLPG